MLDLSRTAWDSFIRCKRCFYLERKGRINFEMTVHEPYEIERTGNDEEDTKKITLKINQIIEKMIIKNPTQWIWSHNRWK